MQTFVHSRVSLLRSCIGPVNTSVLHLSSRWKGTQVENTYSINLSWSDTVSWRIFAKFLYCDSVEPISLTILLDKRDSIKQNIDIISNGDPEVINEDPEVINEDTEVINEDPEVI